MSALVENGSVVEGGSVVEKGSARCPRCAALAEYSFLEIDGGILRYEVACSTCGHVYCETCTPSLVA